MRATCDRCGSLMWDGTVNPGDRFCMCVPGRAGLGDRVASALDAVGITKKRVQAVASAVGIKDCGCAKRQERLNELGRKLGIG